jgi:5-methylcytosine-specific restriction enzyme A
VAWETSDRKSTLPPDWPQRRQVVLRRAEGRCEVRKKDGRRCWDKAKDVDHKVPHSEGGSDDYFNLQAICEWHHKKKSSAEGGRAFQAADAERRKLLKRTPEKHPGVIEGEPRPTKYKGF